MSEKKPKRKPIVRWVVVEGDGLLAQNLFDHSEAFFVLKRDAVRHAKHHCDDGYKIIKLVEAQ